MRVSVEEERFNSWLIDQVAWFVVSGLFETSHTWDELVSEIREANASGGFTFEAPPVGWFRDPGASFTHTEEDVTTIRSGLFLTADQLAQAIERAKREWQTLVDGGAVK